MVTLFLMKTDLATPINGKHTTSALTVKTANTCCLQAAVVFMSRGLWSKAWNRDPELYAR